MTIFTGDINKVHLSNKRHATELCGTYDIDGITVSLNELLRDLTKEELHGLIRRIENDYL